MGRPTFDVPFAEEYAARTFVAREAIAGVAPADISAILLLQVTFTDASMTVEIARAYPGLPLGIWAFPEPRAGGRLRLNSFCGLNLAAHALGRAGITHAALYAPTNAKNLAQELCRLTTATPMPAARLRQPRISPETLSVSLSGARGELSRFRADHSHCEEASQEADAAIQFVLFSGLLRR